MTMVSYTVRGAQYKRETQNGFPQTTIPTPGRWATPEDLQSPHLNVLVPGWGVGERPLLLPCPADLRSCPAFSAPAGAVSDGRRGSAVMGWGGAMG